MAATTDIGIDLGTSSILVYAKGKGIVLKEPSVVAYDKDADKVRAIGEEARQMIGRTPGNIMAVRPMRQGVITDFLITERMLRYFIQKAMGRRAFRKPRISVCVPSGVTEVERKAVEEATYQAGAREVLIVPEPVAAAIGSGIDITKPCGNMIVDIGGGTTDIAVISLAGTVVSNSVKISSETFDQDIIRYVRKTYNVFIGEQTAEAVKSGLVPLIRGPRRKRWRSREETSSPDFRRRLRFPPTKSEVPLSRRQTRLRTRSVPCWKNAAGTGIRCFRPRHYPDRRRQSPCRNGRADPGADRHQYRDSRKSGERRCAWNRPVPRSDE